MGDSDIRKLEFVSNIIVVDGDWYTITEVVFHAVLLIATKNTSGTSIGVSTWDET